MRTKPKPDAIDQAIAGVPRVRVEFNVNSPDGKGGVSSKAVAIELPADLTEPEAFAFMGGAFQIARQVTLKAEQQRTSGLVIARGNLPPART